MQSLLRALLFVALSAGFVHAQSDGAGAQEPAHKLGLFPRRATAEQKRLEDGLIGCWSLMQFESRNTDIQPGSVSCFITFQDGFSTTWWSARMLGTDILGNPETNPVVQAEVRRYRISETLELQMVATQKVDNMGGDVAFNANREPLEYEIEIEERSDEMTLRRLDGTRMTFRRLNQARFPLSAVEHLTRATADGNLRRPLRRETEPTGEEKPEPTPREQMTEELQGCWSLTDYSSRDVSVIESSVRSFLTFQDGYSTIWWAAERESSGLFSGGELTAVIQAEARLFRVSEHLTLQMSPLRTFSNTSGELLVNVSRQPSEYVVEFDEVTRNLVLNRSNGTRMTYRRVASKQFPETAIERLNETRGGRIPLPPGNFTRGK